jgi:5-methylcytosine-specific restriction endonuclease McrA
MTRAVSEWIGKTDDTPCPPRVQLRIFNRYGGVCYLSGIKIRPGDTWHVEHVIAIINEGENRESNMAPALYEPHKVKTKADVAEKSKVATIRKKHLGLTKSRNPMPYGRGSKFKRKFNGEVVPRD